MSDRAIAWMASARLEHLLFGVRPRDVPVFVGAAVAFLLLGWAASAVPAWRATRVTSSEALRGE